MIVDMEIDKLIKQQRFRDGYQKAIINLLYTSNYFRDAHNTVFGNFKIQSQHFNVLRILKGKYPEPVSPGYILDVIIDKGADLTRLLDKLEKLGWVQRKICQDNKRKVHVLLTEAGNIKLTEISTAVEANEGNYRYMTEEEYQKLSILLDKMRG